MKRSIAMSEEMRIAEYKIYYLLLKSICIRTEIKLMMII